MKSLIIFVMLIIHFAFSTTFINASGFNESYSLRSGLSAVNEAGIIFYIMEIWKDVKGYEGHYQISDNGRVRGIDRKVKSRYKGKYQFIKGKVLKFVMNNRGYIQYTLSKESKLMSYKIHRLVALHFIPNPENKPEVNHKNGIKADNRVENLEWVTHQENIIHSFKNGFHKSQRGALNHNAKLNEAQVKEIRQLYATKNYSQKQMASKYNLSVSHLGKIVNYKAWKNQETISH